MSGTQASCWDKWNGNGVLMNAQLYWSRAAAEMALFGILVYLEAFSLYIEKTGMVSASETDGTRFETRFHWRSPVSLVHVKSDVGQTSLLWCGAEVWRGRCELRCRPRNLTAIQNYEVLPKIASKGDVNITKLST
ncbi:hypothetical protein AVEN_254125-1 [Araneus ventricosus]|uniref:Uncharacterized protein n=1 Tax=Araneus ventricosus TaxID=182803 RepID=A0A4Y2C018_ARAVE|nr:hypothetical protein AVEN_254125-1 [Araneus ventricosus]